MSSKMFNPGDIVKKKSGGVFSNNAYEVEIIDIYKHDSGLKDIDHHDIVWLNTNYAHPTSIEPEQLLLVRAAPSPDGWRTVTKRERRMLKALLNESVEFRIQVRVKGA